MVHSIRLSARSSALALACMLAGGAAWGQSTCAPSALGSPCALGGPALQPPNEPALNLGIGNPIHLATGNKYQRETDLPAAADTPGLQIVRHYNARDTRRSRLGLGWSLSYDAQLHRVGDTWQIVQPDGSRILFRGSGGSPRPNRHGSLEPQGTGWRWTWPGGRTLHFNARGWLSSIRLAPGHTLTLAHHDTPGPLHGAVSAITHGNGARLILHYEVLGGHAYLDRIDSPAGTFRYHYEAVPVPADLASGASDRRLTRLIRPDGMQRHYLYEPEHQSGNPGALTGLAIASANGRHVVRTNTWAYDKTGRAILSTQGGPDATKGRVTIAYAQSAAPDSNGLTRVSDAAGRETRFTTAIRGGRHVLLRTEGAGCAGCPAPGTEAQYDAQGRMTRINGTRLARDPTGAITALSVSGSGWPGLAFRYQAGGQRAAWESAATGTEHTHFDAGRRPAQRVFANGDVWAYAYDAHGRPVEVRESSGGAVYTTTLSWRGRRLEHVSHPHESEWREHDTAQRMLRRTVERSDGKVRTRYSDAFQYDAQGRLARHDLPEGGALVYHHTREGRLRQVDWIDRNGQHSTVIASAPGQPGYRYGNGLALVTRRTHGHDTDLIVADGTRIIMAETRHFDTDGRLAWERHAAPGHGLDETWRYAHDEQGRLAAAQRFIPAPAGPGTQRASANPGSADTSHAATAHSSIWYAWRDDGSLAARRDNGRTLRPAIIRDASGLPRSVDGIALRFGPGRRLSQATRGATVLATYRHNAFGQRIAATTPLAHTDYFYLDNRVVAEAARPAPANAPMPREASAAEAVDAQAPSITRRYVYAGHVLVGLIDYEPARPTSPGILYAVHADLLGAPRAVTDASRAIRWLASYTPTGEATRVSGDLTLDVRLPGQMVDAATGWHDNLLRTYHPALGQYLEPDPLGPVPGNQAFGYARQRPRRYTDPMGLLLFAFDGTRNSPRTHTNVWKMAQLYLDGPVFYQAGPGSPDTLNWDAVTAHSAPDILSAQWDALLRALVAPGSRNDTIPIDIIGFSRGAALARHFANQIASHVRDGYFSYTDAELGAITACVDLRFMGLFDTVAQFGLLGAQNANYDLSIASAWEWVAHAVALHERRRLFPVVSIGSQGENAVEAPFIGAHADIGGGISPGAAGRPASQGDLADVALNWMLWQARVAAARFAPPAPDDREVTAPILHDQRLAATRATEEGDRRVDGPDGRQLVDYQDDHARLGRAQRAATESLIARIDHWRSLDTDVVGSVDMDGYARWLHDELGWQSLPA